MINKIKKHIRKYISFACSLLLIPIFSVNVFAYEVEFHLYNRHESTYHGDTIQAIIDTTVPMTYVEDGGFYRYEFTSSSSKSYSNLFFGSSTHNFYYPYEPDLYDYYAVGFLSINVPGVTSSLNSSFDVSDIYLYEFNSYGTYNRINTNADIHFSSNANSFIYNFTFPLTSNYDLSVLEFVFNPILNYKDRSGVIEEYCVAVLAVSKDTSSDEVNAIVNAINNQTSSLGSQLGDIDSGIQQGNDLIENGNESTQSAVSDFNEVFEDFNNELDTWEQFDDDIIGEFNAANDNYKTELNNFSLSGSLLNAGNWLSTSMQTVYDNSSDYKMLWLVPLLFGIPILLFIIRKSGDDE